MSKKLFLALILFAALTIQPAQARAHDDDGDANYGSYGDSYQERRSDDRYIFDRDRRDERVINDTHRNSDSDFGNDFGYGRSGSKTLGQTVTDQLTPIGR